MHKDLADPAKLTDSMRMFKLGARRRQARKRERQAPNRNGSTRATARAWSAPEGELRSPAFALDGGEEPEIVGVYVIDERGAPVRVGFALGNEFSDHVTERENYLWLAHSKLRPASFGPELLVGESSRGYSGRLAHPARQGGDLGEAVPLRRTKYGALDRQSRGAPFQICALPPAGRRPRPFLRHRDALVQRRYRTQKGDVFEIESEPFGLPLRNRLGSERPASDRSSGIANNESRRESAARSKPGRQRPPCQSPTMLARARCHQPLRRGRGGPSRAWDF